MEFQCKRCIFFDDDQQKCDKELDQSIWCSSLKEDIGKATILDRCANIANGSYKKKWNELEPYLISERELLKDIAELKRKENADDN